MAVLWWVCFVVCAVWGVLYGECSVGSALRGVLWGGSAAGRDLGWMPGGAGTGEKRSLASHLRGVASHSETWLALHGASSSGRRRF